MAQTKNVTITDEDDLVIRLGRGGVAETQQEVHVTVTEAVRRLEGAAGPEHEKLRRFRELDHRVQINDSAENHQALADAYMEMKREISVAEPKRRSVWGWVLAALGILAILVLIMVLIAAFLGTRRRYGDLVDKVATVFQVAPSAVRESPNVIDGKLNDLVAEQFGEQLAASKQEWEAQEEPRFKARCEPSVARAVELYLLDHGIQLTPP